MQTSNQNIVALVNDVSFLAQQVFKQRFSSAYLMGSLARGGFSEVASDIDIGIILKELDAADSENMDLIQTRTANKFSSVKNNLSIFWGSIESINCKVDAGRYPPFDRLDLIENALLLSGEEIRSNLRKPSKKELEIAGAQLALSYLGSNERIDEFLNCERISDKGVVYVTKTILFPARFIYLQRTAEIAGNEASYQYYIENFSGEDARLVQQGYQWRLDGLPEDLSVVNSQLSKGLVKLYCNFIDIYIVQMDSYHEYEIKSKLEQWKQAITATY